MVADVKPVRLSQLSHGLETIESIALHTPATLLAEHPGHHVSDGIDVRRNIKTPPFEVVAGIHNDSELFRRNYLMQAIDEFGATCAPAEHDDHSPLRA